MAFAYRCNLLLELCLSLLLSTTVVVVVVVIVCNTVGTIPSNIRSGTKSGTFHVETTGAGGAAEEFIVFGSIAAAGVAPDSF